MNLNAALDAVQMDVFMQKRNHHRGVGTGPAGPAPAGPKFPLSIKIETHNSKKF